MEEVEPLLTKAEVAKILGVKESWLSNEIARGNFPHIRLGRRKYIRFRKSHVAKYLEDRERGDIGADTDDLPQ